jgi:uncharacterized iron-regulated membrane protein
MNRTRAALWLRGIRPVHRYVGIFLAAFMLIIGVTGILLGWKKDAEWLQPPTKRGTVVGLDAWLPLSELLASAEEALLKQLRLADPGDLRVDRMDVRPDRGIVKVRFENGFWEVQVDGATGSVLSAGQRHADWVEMIHDGSILGDRFKFWYMNLSGLGLVALLVSGWWLWYGPRRLRHQRRVGNGVGSNGERRT